MISQLYHAPWIDSLRATRLGGLLLGVTFIWSDMACYTAGVALAMILDLSLRRIGRKPASDSSLGVSSAG